MDDASQDGHYQTCFGCWIRPIFSIQEPRLKFWEQINPNELEVFDICSFNSYEYLFTQYMFFTLHAQKCVYTMQRVKHNLQEYCCWDEYLILRKYDVGFALLKLITFVEVSFVIFDYLCFFTEVAQCGILILYYKDIQVRFCIG